MGGLGGGWGGRGPGPAPVPAPAALPGLCLLSSAALGGVGGAPLLRVGIYMCIVWAGPSTDGLIPVELYLLISQRGKSV